MTQRRRDLLKANTDLRKIAVKTEKRAIAAEEPNMKNRLGWPTEF